MSLLGTSLMMRYGIAHQAPSDTKVEGGNIHEQLVKYQV